MKSSLLSLLASFVLVLPFSASVLARTAADSVSVSDAYVRASPPGAPTAAAFMILRNSDSVDHQLVVVSSSISKAAELHTSLVEDGMMRMRRMGRVTIPAKAAVVFETGGLHMMLIGLRGDPKPGDEVEIELGFEDGSKTILSVPVRSLQLPGHEGVEAHDHMMK